MVFLLQWGPYFVISGTGNRTKYGYLLQIKVPGIKVIFILTIWNFVIWNPDRRATLFCNFGFENCQNKEPLTKLGYRNKFFCNFTLWILTSGRPNKTSQITKNREHWRQFSLECPAFCCFSQVCSVNLWASDGVVAKYKPLPKYPGFANFGSRPFSIIFPRNSRFVPWKAKCW